MSDQPIGTDAVSTHAPCGIDHWKRDTFLRRTEQGGSDRARSHIDVGLRGSMLTGGPRRLTSGALITSHKAESKINFDFQESRMSIASDGPDCPKNIFAALVYIVKFQLALKDELSLSDLEDVEETLAALHCLYPGFDGLKLFDGFLFYQRKRFDEAEAIFNDLGARSVCVPLCKAMVLACHRSQGALDWKGEAEKLVREYAEDDAGRLAKIYLANEDLNAAIASAHRTGHFVTPESVEALTQEHASTEQPVKTAASTAANGDGTLALSYLRV
ncbi:hypothetical protein GWC77_24090 [Paraburkholderia sp. NMBU_R16]|uniref:HrpB1 family type III secretion system apparatus protein n=1 Tax=Paraburkholderia sp. NMBU_R16 TaxID=2698676 RepID=UPI00156597D8|nr:HrpB1 family type III secretion system apparatus protein [Paraburkholderia sp. NMBU_R16]NRO98991.1 hypothetical protein [Paraburkholderia sp. NMBU_R16]